ncbi:DUF4194 domain-containing protein [Propionivibrio limicola]|uniref:DUF4194 domain-containing protein n=1 Tax=Propionivibrio limicola TaxID=167645 RepID=UPI001292836A|nr:DUF4194 domain-containing protein [Propionivibrio limicola]
MTFPENDLPGVEPEIQPRPELSTLVISLLKGVIYREADERLWGALLDLRVPVRDYVAVLALELIVDEAEGYAFLKSRQEAGEDEAGAGSAPKPPRLIARRPLSFPVSLLLALLRKKLLEFDAGGGVASGDGGVRLVLTRDDIVELVRVFLPASSNDARLIDQIETHINKVVDLGFLRRLKAGAGSPPTFEVRRILKAFVDAQWLAEFDSRLAGYQAQLAGESDMAGDTGDR